MKKLQDEYDKEIVAICPLCEKKHTLIMYWTGNGTPRIYCESCKLNRIKGNTLTQKIVLNLPLG